MAATTNATRRGARKPAQSVPIERRNLRASASKPLRVNAAAKELRSLMTEQCQISTGFATFYEGSRAEFAAAGFPMEAMPSDEQDLPLKIDPGPHSYQDQVDAWFRVKGTSLELEIHWGSDGPGDCGHPALTEIARMMMISMAYWADTMRLESRFEVPVERLLERAEDYNISPEKRFSFTPEFGRQLERLRDAIRVTIRRGEIIPMEPVMPSEDIPGGNVVKFRERCKPMKTRPL